MVRRGSSESAAATAVNDVRLRGRLAGIQDERELPSGDRVVTFRVVVEREPGSGGSARVDALDCAAFRADPRRKVSSWQAGDEVEVRTASRVARVGR